MRTELEELSAQYSESLLEADATKRALSHSALQQQQVLAATEADLRQVRDGADTVTVTENGRLKTGVMRELTARVDMRVLRLFEH